MNNKTRNSNYTKNYNQKLILRIIQKQPLSRAEIARQTGLTRASVTIIINQLIDEGIVMETCRAESGIGRKPVLLDLCITSYYSLGLNISRKTCSLGIVDIKGKVISKTKIDMKNIQNPYLAIEKIGEIIKSLIHNTDIPKDKIIGLGISTPGPVDANNGIILTPPNFDMWHDIAIVDEFKKIFDFDIFLHNNSSALCLAEINHGLGKKYSNFILLVVDSGVGSGVTINNKLYSGIEGIGCEIGHTSINHMGEMCDCGQYGCLELYASIPQLLTKAKEVDDRITSWNDIVDKALDGDTWCNKLIEKEADYLTCGLVNAVNILQIDAIVLTGYILYKSDLLVNLVKKQINSRAISRYIHPLDVFPSSIISDSEIIAASTIIFDALIFSQ